MHETTEISDITWGHIPGLARTENVVPQSNGHIGSHSTTATTALSQSAFTFVTLMTAWKA